MHGAPTVRGELDFQIFSAPSPALSVPTPCSACVNDPPVHFSEPSSALSNDLVSPKLRSMMPSLQPDLQGDLCAGGEESAL